MLGTLFRASKRYFSSRLSALSEPLTEPRCSSFFFDLHAVVRVVTQRLAFPSQLNPYEGPVGALQGRAKQEMGVGLSLYSHHTPSPRPLLVCFPLTFTAGADLGSTWHSGCYFRTFLPRPPMGSHGLGQWVFRAPVGGRGSVVPG